MTTQACAKHRHCVPTIVFISAVYLLLRIAGNPATTAAPHSQATLENTVEAQPAVGMVPNETQERNGLTKTGGEQLCATLSRMFRLADPHLGTVADRPSPGKARFSRFRDKSMDEHLFFDVGNNVVSASVTPRGAIHRAMIFTGCAPTGRLREKGAWFSYDYLNCCDDATFSFKTTGAFIQLARKGLHQDTSLILGCFPLTKVGIDTLTIRQVIMAPILADTRLRALLVGFYVETDREDGVSAALSIPDVRKGRNHADDKRAGRAEFVALDGFEDRRKLNTLYFFVRKGEPLWIPFLLVMGESQQEFEQNRDRAKSMASESLIGDTMAFFSGRIPRMTIAGEPATPLYSIIRRSIYAQLITPLLDGQGRPVGCAGGTDVSEPIELGRFNLVWMMDVLYNHLYASMISPEHIVYGIRFSMTRSVPHYAPLAIEEDAESGTKSDRRPWSLSNAVVPVVLAGAYYSATADGETLRQIQEMSPITGTRVPLQTAIEQLLDSLLRTRGENAPMLLESRWLSDGHSKGKYHTGSNVLAWYAFHSAARLLREVFRDERKAEEYRLVAQRMKKDIRKYCTVEHKGKTMFCEGYKAPLIHDGEESGTTIAPFLGFCAADDPAMLAYKQFGCSPENPHWDELGQGIAWYKRITFPGFMTEMAAADTEQELARVLRKVCALADVDGQWWWWPIDPKSGEIERGAVSKCGYGTGIFLIRFINTILGINWDAPTKNLTIRPFVPWNDFDCSGLNVGSLRLDLKYHNDATGARLFLEHNQNQIHILRLIIRAPVGAKGCSMNSSSKDCEVKKGGVYYGRPTWEVVMRHMQESQVTVELRWHFDSASEEREDRSKNLFNFMNAIG